MQGSCLCGGVVFEIQDVVGPFELCHCSRCRKASGSAHTALLGVRSHGYRIAQGMELIRSYKTPVIETPPPYTVFFCSKCGSPVPDPDPEGDWLEIPAGLLDDDPEIYPDKHIYVDCMARWDQIRSKLPEFTRAEIRQHRKQHGRLPNGSLSTPDSRQ